jgi:hypothetical protein
MLLTANATRKWHLLFLWLLDMDPAYGTQGKCVAFFSTG